MSATYVACASPAFVVSATVDLDDKIVSLHQSPIVAWGIDTFAHIGLLGEPVTTEPLPAIFAIYFPDTCGWIVPNDTTGTGLDDLLGYFKSL